MCNYKDYRINADARSSYPSGLSLARGLIPTHEAHIEYGRMNVPQADTTYDLWSGAAAAADTSYNWLTEATTLEVASTSANDAWGGTGATIILIEGLDANRNKISEAVPLTGQTPASTTKSFLRINKLLTPWCGSLQYNEGNIWVGASGTTWSDGAPTTYAEKLGHIAQQRGESTQAIYSVPLGYKAVITFASGSISKSVNKAADLELWVRDYEVNSYNNLSPWLNQLFLGLTSTGSSFIKLENTYAMREVPSGSDIKLTINGNFASSDAMGRFAIIEYKDDEC